MDLHDIAYIASAREGFQQVIPELPGKGGSQSRCGAKVFLSTMNSTQTRSQSRKCHRGFESESVSHSVMSNPVACQTSQSMGFSRQEYWSGLPCSPLGDLPEPGIRPKSLTSPALAGGFFTHWAIREAPCSVQRITNRSLLMWRRVCRKKRHLKKRPVKRQKLDCAGLGRWGGGGQRRGLYTILRNLDFILKVAGSHERMLNRRMTCLNLCFAQETMRKIDE